MVLMVERRSDEDSMTNREISTDQLLGEGCFAEVEVQAVYDEETLALCQMSALKAWDEVEESGEKDLNHLLRLCKVQKKHSLTFTKTDFRCGQKAVGSRS